MSYVKGRMVLRFNILPLALLSCYLWMNSVQATEPLPPRFLLNASAGGSASVGQADLLLSLEGDERHNFYVDPQAAYGTDEQWYTDLG